MERSKRREKGRGKRMKMRHRREWREKDWVDREWRGEGMEKRKGEVREGRKERRERRRDKRQERK